MPATRDEIWRAWTTTEGAVTFFAPAANIRLVPGGPFELFFDTEAPAGLQGSQGVLRRLVRRFESGPVDWEIPDP